MNSTLKVLLGLGLLFIGGIFVWFFFFQPKSTTPPVDQTVTVSPTLPPSTSESPPFVNTIWTATSIGDNSVVAGTMITAQFDDQNRLTGSDGCNSFSTNYTLEGSTLTLDPAMVSTEKACDDAVMSQADTFTQTLLNTNSIELGDGVLVLLQNGVKGLTFVGQSNPLSKTSWNVTGYNNGKQAVVGPIAGTALTMTFGDDGTISGNSGCNSFSGQYSLSGQSLTISPLATTMRACIEPEGVDTQETAFLTALQQATMWQLQGSQLFLRNAEDAIAVTGLNSLVAPTP